MPNNKLIIRRDWLGRIKEVELDCPNREPEEKPILELLSTVEAIFGNTME